jgi:acetylornithine deacetylase
LGDNAIYRMGRVLEVLQQYARDVVPTLGRHPLLGQPTLSIGRIFGGVSVNTVPDCCTIEIDRRVVPGEDPRDARRHAVQAVARALGDDPLVEHAPPFLISSGLSDELSRAFAARLSETICRHGGSGRRLGVSYGTDAPAFAGAGIPTVVFGPGSIEQAHTADEWVAVEQLHAATEVLFRFASEAHSARNRG